MRAQMIAGMVYEKDSIAAQASSIGQLESVGLSWKLIDQDLEAPQGSDSGRYPESRPHLFHPVAPDPGASAACEGRGKGGPS